MAIKLKKIFSLLLVLIFITPTFVKIEHHHDDFVCSAKNELHFHNYHQICSICSFEFSTFADSNNLPFSTYFNFLKDKICLFKQVDSFSSFLYSFLLRAPPFSTDMR